MKGYSGWITREAFAGSDFTKLHEDLETFQADFLYRHARMYRGGYLIDGDQSGYTGDHLHGWSRPYEYAYIASNLGGSGSVLDMGSGFSFFPFYCQSRGCQVTCTDIQPLQSVFAEAGLRFVKDDITETSLRETFDIIYSVSVLEHIPNRVAAVHALSKLLKPGGKLLLTMDCDLGRSAGDGTPCLEELYEIVGLLDATFDSAATSRNFRRPDDLITTHSFLPSQRWRVPWAGSPRDQLRGLALLKEALRETLRPPGPLPTLAVFVGMWSKRQEA